MDRTDRAAADDHQDGEEHIEAIAASLRQSYAASYLEGMMGPTSRFADRVEVRYVPPRSTDGWFEGKMLHEYQLVEERILRSVVPDARFTDVKVVTRADDQIICVFTMRGHLKDGREYVMPCTIIYDLKAGKIIRVTGLYDQERLRPFSEAFEAASKTDILPIEMAPPVDRKDERA